VREFEKNIERQQLFKKVVGGGNLTDGFGNTTRRMLQRKEMVKEGEVKKMTAYEVGGWCSQICKIQRLPYENKK